METLPSQDVLTRIADVLKAMADPTRLKILHTLHEGEHCVNDVLEKVGGSQANISKHLSVLRRAGLVECHREGLRVYYSVADEGVFTICSSICDSLEFRLEREHEAMSRGREEMRSLEHKGQ